MLCGGVAIVIRRIGPLRSSLSLSQLALEAILEADERYVHRVLATAAIDGARREAHACPLNLHKVGR